PGPNTVSTSNMNPQRICCARAASDPSASSTWRYETTAMMFTNEAPSAPTRPKSPTNNSAGKKISPEAPMTAATSGGSTGTWYSVLNRSSVPLQDDTLSHPDFQNCQLT